MTRINATLPCEKFAVDKRVRDIHVFTFVIHQQEEEQDSHNIAVATASIFGVHRNRRKVEYIKIKKIYVYFKTTAGLHLTKTGSLRIK